MLKRFTLIAIFLFAISFSAYPHGGDHHMFDMMSVLGLDVNTSDRPNHPNEKAKEWCKYITNNLIDNEEFHYQLFDRYGISFRGPRLHRYLFHWGYDAMPWSSAIESKIRAQAPRTQFKTEYLIQHIKSDLVKEQKRRNKILNDKTEELFGFAHGGRDAAYARFFAAMAYNTHLLGDYESENTIFDGLCNLNDLIGMIVVEIRNLDNKTSKEIIRGMTQINNSVKNNQQKADRLMAYLKTKLPNFISNAQDGSIKRRLEKRGFRFNPL